MLVELSVFQSRGRRKRNLNIALSVANRFPKVRWAKGTALQLNIIIDGNPMVFGTHLGPTKRKGPDEVSSVCFFKSSPGLLR